MNWQIYFGSFANPYGFKFLAPIIILVAVWSVVWKAMALWRAARNGDRVWYIALLLINTVGILEILYLYVFGKSKSNYPMQM